MTFASRVERPDGKTSPEELIASAHATCHAMALSNTLAENGNPPERLTVDAVCTLDDQQLKITTVNLDVRGQVPGLSGNEFEENARQAEQVCPVSNALRNNVEIKVNGQPGGCRCDRPDREALSRRAKTIGVAVGSVIVSLATLLAALNELMN